MNKTIQASRGRQTTFWLGILTKQIEGDKLFLGKHPIQNTTENVFVSKGPYI